MQIKNNFHLGEIIYLICDMEQLPRMVTAISVRINGYIEYECTYGTVASWHIENELNHEKTVW